MTRPGIEPQFPGPLANTLYSLSQWPLLLLAAIMMLYKNMKVKVRSPDRDTDYFNIVAGAARRHISPISLYHLSRLHA